MPKIIPNSDKIKIKKDFEKRYRNLLGNNYDEFLKYSLSFLRRSIRINTLKKKISYVKKKLQSKGWKFEKIPWCNFGFWIEHKNGRRDIGNTREHSLGYFYVQEAASMIPPVVLDSKPKEFILDMCAAPGSKTTQIAQHMENKGLIIANDYKGTRMKSLDINLQRIGITNTVSTLMPAQWFLKKSLKFDKILLDAPCSGTGTIRKSLKTFRIWNPNMITKLANTQKKLIETAFQVLKKKGILVYSTCSVEPEENEGVISHLLGKFNNAKIEKIELKINKSNPIMEFNNEKYHKEVSKCLRIWPQDNDTEGFFVAKIRRI
jgi:NOL1/NOP2/sun family putative RNA methylase